MVPPRQRLLPIWIYYFSNGLEQSRLHALGCQFTKADESFKENRDFYVFSVDAWFERIATSFPLWHRIIECKPAEKLFSYPLRRAQGIALNYAVMLLSGERSLLPDRYPAISSMTTSTLTTNFFDPVLATRQALPTNFLSAAVLKNRLAHAYLLAGRAFEDAEQIAVELAAFLNCTRRQPLTPASTGFSTDQLSCLLYFSGRELEKAVPQYCQSCRWILDRKHPQALVKLDSEGSKSGRISVDKARALTGELAKESSYTRVIIIEDANQEIFHRPAANAILKTMESPRTACVFCLFAVREEEVLPTVVSRCQVIPTVSTENHVISMGQERSKSLLHDASVDPENQDQVKLFADMKEIAADLKRVSRTTGALTFMEAARRLQDLSSDAEPCWLIDALVEDEITHRGRNAIKDPRVSKYLHNLVSLAEDTKLQITQYVAVKSALESFCLSWWQLKNISQVW